MPLHKKLGLGATARASFYLYNTEAEVRAIARRVTARLRRRLTPRQTGRLDFRRTIRAAVPRGGIPFERHYRGRRPGAPDLVALCDLSASTAIARPSSSRVPPR